MCDIQIVQIAPGASSESKQDYCINLVTAYIASMPGKLWLENGDVSVIYGKGFGRYLAILIRYTLFRKWSSTHDGNCCGNAEDTNWCSS